MSDEAAIPSRIGPYEVLSVLGRGGMGVVYLGYDPRLERHVAIKVVGARLSADAAWSERFRREARILAKLNHPNVATIHTLELEGDREFLTMEHIIGRNLADLIDAHDLSLPEALSIGRQVARGLEAAHAVGVIHRDLKPQNVMVTPDGHAKVLDFGLAVEARAPREVQATPRGSLDDRAQPDPSVDSDPSLEETWVGDPETAPRSESSGSGTPGYMSPEQIQGGTLDQRTDVFAFGCVLFECLAGVRAFEGQTPVERMRRSIAASPDLPLLPESTPIAVRALIAACLEKEATARPADLGSAREVLDAALAARSWERPVLSTAIDGATTADGSAAAGHRGSGDAASTDPATVHTKSGHPTAGPPPDGSGAPVRRNNLPHQLSSFIGREEEVATLAARLAEQRLVTLTGVGGTGKTRTALEAARTLLIAFADGVWSVELAPVAEESHVETAVAKVLGVTESQNQSVTEALGAYLRPRKLLLVLDNCEHLVDAVARFVERVVATAPQVRILATSREALGIPGEVVVPLAPLALPTVVPPTPHAPPAGASPVPSLDATDSDLPFTILARNEAIRLFTERARHARPTFVLTTANIGTVVEICRRLDGLPLALELAAARLRALPLEEIARRLEGDLRILRSSGRGDSGRHQTLEALIGWSHSLLTPGEQLLFRRLAIFRGGFTLEAAEAVCADEALESWEVLDVLSRLIDKSLVVFTGERYRMLETVRAYARERLVEGDEEEIILDRGRQFFAEFARGASHGVVGPDQVSWLARCDAEIANIRAIVAALLERQEARNALEILGFLTRYFTGRGLLREGVAWLGQALALPEAAPPSNERGMGLNALGSCYLLLHRLDDAAHCYEASVATARDLGDLARVSSPLMNLATVSRLRGDLVRATSAMEEVLALTDPTDHWHLAAIHTNLGSVALVAGRYDDAFEAYSKARAIQRQLGDRVSETFSSMHLGIVELRRGRFHEAKAIFAESLAVFTEVGDRNLRPYAAGNYTNALIALEEYDEAIGVIGRTLREAVDVGLIEMQVFCLEQAGAVARFRGRAELGLPLLAAAEAVRRRNASPRPAAEQQDFDTVVAGARAQVAAETADRLWEEGSALDLSSAIVLAQTWLDEDPEENAARMTPG